MLRALYILFTLNGSWHLRAMAAMGQDQSLKIAKSNIVFWEFG